MPDYPTPRSKTQTLKLKAYTKLMRATDTLTRAIHPHLKDFNLTFTQFGVLEALFHLGPLCQKDIAQKILKSTGNITQTIDALERRKLVSRALDPQDRRYIKVRLTEEGVRLMQDVFPVHLVWVDRAFAPLSLDEIEELGRLLKALGKQSA
jgi:MarR family 2-MHQ and catechol resistance regulon transcriptional repressor